MCYSEGSLQALLDGQITGDEKKRMEEHLLTCGACRDALKRLADAQEFAGKALVAYLDAGEGEMAGDGSADDAAWERLRARLRLEAEQSDRQDTWWMEVLKLVKRRRAVTIATAAALTIAVALSFGSVRAAAGRFLSVFRVSRFQTISVSPSDVSRIQQALRDGAGSVDIGNLGKFEFHSNGPSGLVSLEQARQSVDFQLKLPSVVPDGYELQGISSTQGGTISLTLDVDKANQALKSIGATKMLPEDLNGQTFSLKMPVVIDAEYGSTSATAGDIHFIQARSPELDVPGDTTAAAVRDAVLSLPFLPDSIKKQVASVGDWQHTFLVPDIQGSTQKVTVDGADGVFMTAPVQYQDQVPVPGVKNALVWEKDGVVYAVIGTFSLDLGLTMANSMK